MISIRVPGSKSYTNRALLLAALANGKSVIKNILLSDDTKYMLLALRKLGVKIDLQNHTVVIKGKNGLFDEPASPVFVSNAGTVMRFLAATLATQPFGSIITGNKRMKERPIGDLLQALRKLGALAVSLKENNCPPVLIHGPLEGGRTILAGDISSQFLSGLLMASALARSSIEIKLQGNVVSKPYIEMTLQVMKDFGISVKRIGFKKFVTSRGKYRGREYYIEGDASSATYFWGIGALTGHVIGIENIALQSKQGDIKFLNILKKMGCIVQEKKARGIFVKGPLVLKPITENLSDMPDASLTLATICAFARGISRLRGLSNLRIKECDRIHALTKELRKIGVKVREFPDGWEIHGNPELLKKPLKKSIVIETYNDHRIAMCFGMLKSIFPNLKIKNPHCVSKSYPNFWKDLKKILNNLRTNLILTGMRGSGKTTLGKLLAKKLNRKFLDIDEQIAKRSRKSIPEIVAQKGWSYFRKLEHEAVKKMAKLRNAVIAAGGGTFLDPRNTKILKKDGFVIFLKLPIPLLQRRLRLGKNRPSLTGKNPEKELPNVWKKRKKLYRNVADVMVDVHSNSLQKNLLKIFNFL